MVSGTRWPIEDIPVANLRLDLRNVRIPTKDLDEPAIAAYLVEGEDLLGLAQEILSMGYIDNELPVVVKEDGKIVVLEGNRRITVLKALRDSSILGKSAQRIERLASRYPSFEAVPEVRVMVAPSREAAQPLLARLHTGQPKRGWIREQQAIFYHAQLSSTVTMDDLKAQYPTEARQIKRFIHMGEMRNLVRGLNFDDTSLELWVRGNKLPMTSLEYAYERPKIQDALGLHFQDNGLLENKRPSAGQTRGLVYLLGQIRSGRINTRSPELRAKAPEHDAFVAQLQAVVAGRPARSVDPDGGIGDQSFGNRLSDGGAGNGGPEGNDLGRRPSGPTPATPGNNGTSSGDQANSQRQRGPNRGITRKNLDMNGFRYAGQSSGMRRRFEELRSLDVETYPNAAYDLLRTVFECSIKEYLRGKGTEVQERLTLGPTVNLLANEFRNNERMTALILATKRTGSRMTPSEFSGTMTALNTGNHEPDMFADRAVVHDAWDRLKPILVEIVGGGASHISPGEERT